MMLDRNKQLAKEKSFIKLVSFYARTYFFFQLLPKIRSWTIFFFIPQTGLIFHYISFFKKKEKKLSSHLLWTGYPVESFGAPNTRAKNEMLDVTHIMAGIIEEVSSLCKIVTLEQFLFLFLHPINGDCVYHTTSSSSTHTHTGYVCNCAWMKNRYDEMACGRVKMPARGSISRINK